MPIDRIIYRNTCNLECY